MGYTKYRKKPVIVKAIQYNNLNVEEIEAFVGKRLSSEIYDNRITPPKRYLAIDTLEGIMKVSPFDYVIQGIKGEFYACKPDIFTKTYEAVEENS